MENLIPLPPTRDEVQLSELLSLIEQIAQLQCKLDDVASTARSLILREF